MFRFVVQRPIAVSMMFAALLLLGGISLSRLPVALFPAIEFPTVTVLTPYPNVAPEEIENLVTRPIEEALSSVGGVGTIESRSQEGLSVVMVRLDWGTSLDTAVLNIRQKVDLARTRLPQDSGKSIIIKFDPSSEAVMTLVARPLSVPFDQSRDYIEQNARPYFERINGVASVSILGGRRREIQVDVDAGRMRGLGLNLDVLQSALSSANFGFPAGNVRDGDSELTVRVDAEFDQVAAIGGTPVTVSQSGTPIHVRDFAEISDGFREQRGAALHNSGPAILLALKKEPAANTVKTAQEILIALGDINKRFRGRLQFDVIQDRSVHIQEAVNSVRDSAILGGIIAFVVLLLFLGDSRSALIVILSVPVSIMATFVMMFARGLSLNIMSLGGLALGAGMLVDNAIVVLESIHSENTKHPERNAARNALSGVGRVAGSVLSSTLTSIVVFVPVVFTAGIAGAVFKELALTVSFALLASLVCSFTLVPMLASLNIGERGAKIFALIDRAIRPPHLAAGRLTEILREKYALGVSRAIRGPGKFLTACALLTLIGCGLLALPERSLFPDLDRGLVSCEIELPGGTTIEDSLRFHARLHEKLASTGYVRHAVTNIGFDPDDLESLVHGVRGIHLSDSDFYINSDKIGSEAFIRAASEILKGTAGIRARFSVRGHALAELLGTSANRLTLEVEDKSRDRARHATDWAREQIADSTGIQHAHSTSTAAEPRLRVSLDRRRIAAHGLSADTIGGAIRMAVNGQVASRYRENDRAVDIRIRLRESDRSSPENLKRLRVSLPKEGSIELAGFINTKRTEGHGIMLRRDQKRVEHLYVDFNRKDATAVNVSLRGLVKKTRERFPELDRVELRLDNEETMRSLRDLVYAFLLSAILIYMLLAAQFESVLHPFTLALAVPLMMIGVSGALLLSGHGLNISSTLGMIMLAGLVVNSAIVLYEYIRLERSRNAAQNLEDIVIRAGRERLRPILLTTLTTLLGVIPMAWAGGLQAPMAVVVIGGLLVSSVLTLVLFPVLYVLVERRQEQ